MRLAGKTAVITGAASGIGLAIATRFAAEGAAVVAGDWNAARLDAAVEDIRASGGTIVGRQGNIAEPDAAEDLIELAVATHGRLDVLCNNAGVMDYMQGVGELDDERRDHHRRRGLDRCVAGRGTKEPAPLAEDPSRGSERWPAYA